MPLHRQLRGCRPEYSSILLLWSLALVVLCRPEVFLLLPTASPRTQALGSGLALSPAHIDRTKIGTLDVPRLGLGTIAWTATSSEDDDRLAAVAEAARVAGLDFFDTAERYGAKAADLIPAALGVVFNSVGFPSPKTYQGGDCETNLARWADSATIGTKFTPNPGRRTAASVVETCRESAARLGVEQIDLYQIHMPDIVQPFKAFGVEDRRDEVFWDGLAECYLSGLAKNVGVSNYGPTLLERAWEHLAGRGVPLVCNQIHFNMLYRRQGSLATIQKCNELGISTLAYYPLAMGLLTGKLTPSGLRDKSDLRSTELLRYLVGGKGGGFPNTAGDIPKGGISKLLEVLQEVAERNSKTSAQVSLNWVICKGAIPIPGASSIAQVKDNVGSLGWRLSSADVALLDTATDELGFEFRGSGFQTADSKFVGYGFEKWQLD